MNVQDLEHVLVDVAAIAETLFLIGFGIANRWWHSLIGLALFTHTLSLALLLDLSVLGQTRGVEFPDEVVVGVLALIALGCCLQLTAFVVEKARKRRGQRDRLTPPAAV